MLLEHLSEGVTGCLSLREAEGAERRVYVMQGEVLAAHGPDDGPAVVRLLVNNGAVTERQSEDFLARLAEGERTDEILFGQIPDDLLLEVLTERFRQDVLDFISTPGRPDFEPMDAIFVDNIQIGHDSRTLMEDLEACWERIRVLRAHAATIRVTTGKIRPARQEEARLLDLVEGPTRVSDLVKLSPFEAGTTLDLIAAMLAARVLQAEGAFPADDDEPTEVTGDSPLDALDEDVDDAPLDLPSSALDSADVWTGDLGRDAQDALAESWPEAATDVLEPVVELDDLTEPEVNAEEEALRLAAEAALRAEVAAEMAAEMAAEVAAAQARAQDDDAAVEQTDSGSGHVPGYAPPKPPGFSWDLPDHDDPFFVDHDRKTGRGGADGTFIGMKEELVVLRDPDLVEHVTDEESVIEAQDLESLPEEARRGIKALSFGAPPLAEDEAYNAFEIVNEALREISHVLDEVNGPGAGRAFVQLLLEGTPAEFSALFRAVDARKDGSLPIEMVLKNLADRPKSEHRQLVHRGVEDLVERALTLSCEELDDDSADQLAERVLSYQRQLGF